MKYCILIWLCLTQSMVCSARNALAHGAEIFDAYCRGCHALQYARPPLTVSLPSQDATKWFGKPPPDLSLIVTVRGTSWLHDYLTGFYEDSHQRYGENNRLLPNLNMPNPFSMMSLEQKKVLIQDVVFFLSFVADPTIKTRQWTGCWILLWLCCLNVVLYYLYRLIQKKINTKK